MIRARSTCKKSHMPVKSKTPLPLLTGLLCAASCFSAAHAADNCGADRKADDQPDEYHWGLGIGAGIKKSPYRGVKNDTTVLPLLSYENHYIRFFLDTLDVKLPSAGPFDFSLRSKSAHFESGPQEPLEPAPARSGSPSQLGCEEFMKVGSASNTRLLRRCK